MSRLPQRNFFIGHYFAKSIQFSIRNHRICCASVIIAANTSPMRNITLSAFLLFCSFSLSAQLKKTPAPESAFSTQLSKVVLDFPANFQGVQGSRMPAEVDADTYLSTTCLPDALVCKVMRYHSVQDKSASWQAVLYAGENFDEAVKLYKKLHGQVKKTTVRGGDGLTAGFEGKLENIDENVGFTVSSLRLKTSNPRYRDLVAELNISSSYTGWEVRLDLYTKKRLDENGDDGEMK
jgi:hypothetical protein